jgi:hypothetical protein
MDGRVLIYLASRHLTVQPQAQLRVGREHSFACLVSCALMLLSAGNPIWLLRGNFIYFSSQTVIRLEQKVLPSLTNLFEYIDITFSSTRIYTN